LQKKAKLVQNQPAKESERATKVPKSQQKAESSSHCFDSQTRMYTADADAVTVYLECQDQLLNTTITDRIDCNSSRKPCFSPVRIGLHHAVRWFRCKDNVLRTTRSIQKPIL